ncbi:hypothetical protein Tco_1186149 [Tanacetum coccineum]
MKIPHHEHSRNNLPLAIPDLEEFCEKHYEKLLPIMADKYEYEKRKKENLKEVKARLDFCGRLEESTLHRLRRVKVKIARHNTKSRKEDKHRVQEL